MADAEKGNEVLTDEERKAIDADIQKAKDSLVSKEVQEKVDKAKQEAVKETEEKLKTQQEMEKLKQENEALKKSMEDKQKEFATSFSQLKNKVDEIVSSKAPVNVQNPFNKVEPQTKTIDNMSDDEIEKFEEESARAFFGPDYDNRD